MTGGVCWTHDASAPALTGGSIAFSGNGVLQFTGAASQASTSSSVLDATKSFTVAGWFNAVRNTATDEILAVYKIGAPRPDVATELPATPSGEPPIGSGNDAAKVMADGETESPAA